jgi:Fe-S-cluster containining protein
MQRDGPAFNFEERLELGRRSNWRELTREGDLDEDAGAASGAVPRTFARLLAEARSLFRRVDKLLESTSCEGRGECCQLATTGLEPYLFQIEVALLEAALRTESRGWPPERPDGGCPFLDASGRRCSVYGARPFGCRTYFCRRMRASRPYPNVQVEALNAALTRIADRMKEGDRPRSMAEVVAARNAWEEPQA